MGKFAEWPGNRDVLARLLNCPKANLAFTLAVVGSREAANEAILQLSLGHRDDIILPGIHCRVVLASLINMMRAKFNDASISI